MKKYLIPLFLIILIGFLATLPNAGVFSPAPQRTPTLKGIKVVGSPEIPTNFEITLPDVSGSYKMQILDSSRTEVAFVNSDGTLGITRIQAPTASDIEIKLRDASGSRILRIIDSNDAEVGYIDSDGLLHFPVITAHKTSDFEIRLKDSAGSCGLTLQDSNSRQVFRVDSSGNSTQIGDSTISGNLSLSQSSSIAYNSHQDHDGDTKVQVEEGSDDDTFRVDISGNEMLQIDATSIDFFDSSGTTTMLTVNDEMTSVQGGTDRDAILRFLADAGANNDDIWRINVVDGEYFRVESYQSGSYSWVMYISNTGVISAGSLPAVGGDPMCWDGGGNSAIGDCSSTIEVKERVADYSLPTPELRLRTLSEDEKTRIDGYFPGEWKTYTSNIEMLKDIKVHTFNLTQQPEQADEDEIGILGEQLVKINPHLVNIRNIDGENKVTGVAWFNVISWLVKVNQEQQAMIEDLQERVKALEGG